MQDTIKQPLLSVVLPAYNEEASVPRASQVICALLEQANIRHEVIFIDDGSKDKTWNAIDAQASICPQVRGVRFSRNFGKEAAIFAGLAQAQGDCVVVLDCDLQHPPEKILEMYHLWEQGYQVVEGIKSSRGCTSNSTWAVEKPIQEDRARKNAFFSRMASRVSTALRSRSLKSEARDMSMPVALLIRE